MCQTLETPEDIPGNYLCVKCLEQELDTEHPVAQLHGAIQTGDVRLISRILTAHARQRDAVGLACTSHHVSLHTALQAAVAARQLSALKTVCSALGESAAAAASATGGSGTPALHLACEEGWAEGAQVMSMNQNSKFEWMRHRL